jgi:hypothetical protein
MGPHLPNGPGVRSDGRLWVTAPSSVTPPRADSSAGDQRDDQRDGSIAGEHLGNAEVGQFRAVVDELYIAHGVRLQEGVAIGKRAG